MSDLFQGGAAPAKTSAAAALPAQDGYSAKDIEVLEGLEPVRRRPGMYIGGTDERALHHLVAEVLDNAMDEAVAGHASRIELELSADGSATVRDNGRGIPVDSHARFPGKSALEVILTTLHSGGKFGGKAYETSGGLHGVGVSVVNALSSHLRVEVARDRKLYLQEYSRGVPLGPLADMGPVQNRRGTSLTFVPDAEIFGETARFRPAVLYRMVRSKAYLFRGVEIRWRCAPGLIAEDEKTPSEETLRFPNGLLDFLTASLGNRETVVPKPFVGEVETPIEGTQGGRVEWALTWPAIEADALQRSYCNTVPTPQGGTHESGLRNALTRGLRSYGELVGNKRAAQITADDVFGGVFALLSIFIREPQFQGQTKEKLGSPQATRLVETAIKDRFDLYLSGDKAAADALLEYAIDRADDRQRRKSAKETQRKTATRRLRLPGKLADCSSTDSADTEIFLVEGDSAGGSAKQARTRDKQAVLPLRGKILNVASASADKQRANQELKDLVLALGCGSGRDFDLDGLRYERVIIMTDADVDGAHIAALLMTFFFQQMPALVRAGRLFLALPPLYRLSAGGDVAYARDDGHKDTLLSTQFKGKAKVEISRFKGLGEMPPHQLRETTMDPARRTLLRLTLPDPRLPDETGLADETDRLVDDLMGRKPERRFAFITDNARFVEEIDV